ncbi:mucin-associated surface protein (MASP) [Trypanosoma cruzi]|nr:mucin-associated surface protein (MASP) [Trypanosoma cruzi]
MKIGDRELTAAVSCRVWCLFLLLVLALLDVAAVGKAVFCFFFTPFWDPFLHRHHCVLAVLLRPLSRPLWGQLRVGFTCRGVVCRAVRCFIVACSSCVHASPMLMTTTLMQMLLLLFHAADVFVCVLLILLSVSLPRLCVQP